jgi:hypothetical protein
MLKGVRPAHLFPEVAQARRQARARNSSANSEEDASLLLLHGYCAKDNPW